MLFLTTTTATAANAVAAAHIQGLQAFMASEVKERATDAQLEAAAGGVSVQSRLSPPDPHYAANAVAAAHVQGLHAFMASEAKAAATDAQLESAAGLAGVLWLQQIPSSPSSCRGGC